MSGYWDNKQISLFSHKLASYHDQLALIYLYQIALDDLEAEQRGQVTGGDEVDVELWYRRRTLAGITVFRIVDCDLETDLGFQRCGMSRCSIGRMLTGQ